jgi:ABC-type multidrug transport system ATPase subunit
MNGINSESISSDINKDGGTENQGYIRSQSDHHLPKFKEDEGINIKRLPRTTSADASTFPIILEVPIDMINDSPSDNPFVSPTTLSPSSAFHNQHSHCRSTGFAPPERQSSLPDPMSDRVSTILVWKNLTVSTREDKKHEFLKYIKPSKSIVPQKKCLLHNLSGAITGGLWAVMGKFFLYLNKISNKRLLCLGASGSGKSTLLNTLACRLDVKTVVEGEMRLNGSPYDNAELKRVSGYVMQDDLLNGYLTVEETLMFTAELRLPRTFTNKQRKERVEDVMNDLGLVHVRNRVIGTQLKQGISGSERKRVCVSMQLLNRPQLLFLDEPTTGLDSVTALDLLHTLHALAHGKLQEKAVTIVCSIHQPQSKIFNLFDSVTLLKAGYIIYQGPRKQAMVKILI